MRLSSPSRRPLAAFLTTGLALVFALGAAVVSSVIVAAPVSAHTVPVRITPGAEAVLTRAPTRVVLEFDEPVSTSFATVVVTTAAGGSVASGKPTVLGGKVTQALGPDILSGRYRIAYRVVSGDGHPVAGQSAFTVKLAPTASSPAPLASSASPQAATPSHPAATHSADGPTSGEGGWLSRSLVPIAGAVGLVVTVGAGLLRSSRRRRR